MCWRHMRRVAAIALANVGGWQECDALLMEWGTFTIQVAPAVGRRVSSQVALVAGRRVSIQVAPAAGRRVSIQEGPEAGRRKVL